ncbi:hypothetical protein MOJ79_13285 [Calidifontimicrobium sp. SYSU G02091]|uniref:hypothetical protein n=1 Tax=Calidifontimicrobium sp. SYSU G02091 TaxID=2926421 RepID=UPI001F52C6B7|nr:hypothetical protein [Calidifontimicrobium sp. SYSU G02091]MCI1192812.1 hypothetical protein [Calidifontimicrobium sp. SYSU G02091]
MASCATGSGLVASARQFPLKGRSLAIRSRAVNTHELALADTLRALQGTARTSSGCTTTLRCSARTWGSSRGSRWATRAASASSPN